MIHYHGTPISPVSALYEIAGRHFCVSHQAPQDVQRAHMIGQSVMLDNGAFTASLDPQSVTTFVADAAP